MGARASASTQSAMNTLVKTTLLTGVSASLSACFPRRRWKPGSTRREEDCTALEA